MTTKTAEVAKQVESPSKRFTELVSKSYMEVAGTVELPEQVKRLLLNYFTKLDLVLKESESKRLKTPENKRSAVEFSWKNVNVDKLAQESVAFAMVGLDPMQPNHLFMIPYLNGTTNKFDIGFMPGYKGIEVKAKKFGLEFEIPKNEIFELVYSTDIFKPVKKDASNPVESYSFQITNPFERGEIIGGFYYLEFENPKNNMIVMMSINDIMKRKPKYASPEFWGGEKQAYKDGKPTGKEAVDGWFEEMCIKTMKRKAYGSITIDAQKINDQFVSAMEIERNTISIASESQAISPMMQIEQQANSEAFAQFEEIKTPEPVKANEPEPDPASNEMAFPETK